MKNLDPLVSKLEALSKNLDSAESVRERVRIADRVFETLGLIEQEVERFVVSEIGRSSNGHQPAQAMIPLPSTESERGGQVSDRFSGMSLAAAARVLLAEHGALHGKEIERLLKEGGYESASRKFQSTMRVAFDRDGGFENIGGNRWRLRPRGLSGQN